MSSPSPTTVDLPIRCSGLPSSRSTNPIGAVPGPNCRNTTAIGFGKSADGKAETQ
jgi:hypothetical protein